MESPAAASRHRSLGITARHRLWHTYAISIALVVALAVTAAGLPLLWLIQRETRAAADALQAVEAAKASAQIDRFTGGPAAMLRASLALLDSGHLSPPADVQIEFYRLLKQSPAIDSLHWIDGAGHERLRIGRMAPDRLGSSVDRRQAPEFVLAGTDEPWFGPVEFQGNLPRLSMALRGRQTGSGVIVARIDLTQLRDSIGAIRFGHTGRAYVLDPTGRLIAHPEIMQVLAMSDWSTRPPFSTALGSGGTSRLIEFDALDGRPMVARATPLSIPGWLLVTEQTRAEAFAPIRRARLTASSVLVLVLLLGSGLGIVLARRVVQPIRRLAEGASALGEGRLDHRIDLVRSDELGLLAAQFNRMAGQLQDSYAQLEARIAERTQALREANGELEVRRAEAEQASQAKTRFLASASHDLRQPLHTISLLVGVLQRQPVAPETGRLVDTIQQSVAALEALFGSLLDISRLDAGMAEPAPGDCALDELLRRVALTHGPEAERKRLELRIVPSRRTVRTDPALIERVLNNLVSNAIRYTHSGRIVVGCRRRQDGILLQVIDTGIGIEAAVQTRVFDEFYQIDNPERDRTKGLGLGLSIVRRTLDLLGHPFTLRSEPGRGTCFSILLPETAVPAPRVSLPPTQGLRVPGAFIVVIDDEADTRLAMQALCRSWGAHALAAASADECLQALDDHLRHPDLIVCDYRLRQHEDGLAAIERLRAAIGLPIPAIVVTGDIGAADLRRVADQGLPLLHKPVGADRLLAAFEARLASHPSGGGRTAETGSDLVGSGSGDSTLPGHETVAGR